MLFVKGDYMFEKSPFYLKQIPALPKKQEEMMGIAKRMVAESGCYE